MMQLHKRSFRLQAESVVRFSAVSLLLVLLTLCAACSSPSAAYRLTLVHLNDTHSRLEPAAVPLLLDGENTVAQLGGAARLKTAVDRMRSEDAGLLLLHAGDAVQGTLYFTLFNGEVEFDFLNMLGVDAMTFGNHEFDRGTVAIPAWIKRSRFPWLSANIDFSSEPAIVPLVKPYLIREINGEQVAVIGVTTETTPQTTLNVGKALFRDAVESTRKQVAELTARGINKIILLSHLGYQQDKALAAQVDGIDIIVGGHSHTLLGELQQLASLSLIPEGSYPTALRTPEGKPVLVLQAWQWGCLLGRLNVDFTPEGEVRGYSAAPVIPVGDLFVRNGKPVQAGTQPYQRIVSALDKSGMARIVAEDPAVSAYLAPYTAQLASFRKDRVAVATNDLRVGLNSGPGPLVADSMIAAVPHAQLAILNYGGIRKGLPSGPLTVGDLLEVMPFGNTLVLVDLTGAELKAALEDGIDFLREKFGAAYQAMPYLSGARMTIQAAAPKGSRLQELSIRDRNGLYQPLQPTAVYRTVVNIFVAGGGDGFEIIRNAAGFRSDTGIVDSDAFRDYLKGQGSVSNPVDSRITILSDGKKGG